MLSEISCMWTRNSISLTVVLEKILFMKGKSIPGIVVYFPRSVRHTLMDILDFDIPNNSVPTQFFVASFFLSCILWNCILVGPWTFSLYVFNKRKGRSVIHMCSIPYELRVSFTILFVYLFAYLYVCFTDKETEFSKKFCCYKLACQETMQNYSGWDK